MSRIQIVIETDRKNPMEVNKVTVDNRFAYYSSKPKSIEKRDIEVLLNHMDIENFEVIIK